MTAVFGIGKVEGGIVLSQNAKLKTQNGKYDD
jgi:hypothetical protein